MILRNRMKPIIMLRLGLVLFVIASFARLFLHPTTDFSRGFVDGFEGVLYGSAIVFLLMHLIVQRRRKSGAGNGA